MDTQLRLPWDIWNRCHNDNVVFESVMLPYRYNALICQLANIKHLVQLEQFDVEMEDSEKEAIAHVST